MRASGHTAVMARRSEPPNSLDYFPTPPWATRALFEHLLPRLGIANRPGFRRIESVLEPACGEGHMAAVCSEYAETVHASDVFDYGYGAVSDFLDNGEATAAEWIITNPPFNTAIDFAERALFHPAARANRGVALLVRSAWLEGVGRYERLFRDCPPDLVGIFAERVPMVKGRWDPQASTATSYAWFVWLQPLTDKQSTRIVWVPPGQRKALTRPDDAARFGAQTPAPLLEECAV